ncbi:MAG: hypothetical protein JXR19_04035 [Bacteroidia bacterium]
MKYYLFTALLLSGIILHSCKKDEVIIPKDLSSSYMPLNVGTSWIYQMDSGYYAGTGVPVDSFNYHLRHEIVEIIDSSAESISARVEISSRKDTGFHWEFVRAYQITRDENKIVRTDFNIKEIVLSLPLHNNKVWDGNTLNILEATNFIVQDLHIPKSVGDLSFDSTVLVIQDGQLNAVNNFQAEELYAQHVGMVYKHKQMLSNLSNPNNMTGYQYTMTLLEFKP